MMIEEQLLKIKNYDYINQIALKGKILFTGSSLMEMFPVCEIARSRGIEEIMYNRGVGGLNTDEFLEHIDTLLWNRRRFLLILERMILQRHGSGISGLNI